MATGTKEWTKVPSPAGDLRALRYTSRTRPARCPASALVDGSGEGACDDWGGWPERLADLRRRRADPRQARLRRLARRLDPASRSRTGPARRWLRLTCSRAHPSVGRPPVGLFGCSQGG